MCKKIENYLFLILGKISQKPYSFIFDSFGVSIGEEKLRIDDIVIVLRSCVRRLEINHDFRRALGLKTLFYFGAIGLIAKDSLLNRLMITLTKSSFCPKESAMQPLIHKNFLASYLLIQIKLKSYIFEKIKLI